MFHVFEDPDMERPRGPKMKLARSRRTRRGGDEESHTPLLGLLVVNGKRGHVPGGAKAKDAGVEVELAVEGVLDVLCLAEAVLLALVHARARSATRAVRFLGDMESPVYGRSRCPLFSRSPQDISGGTPRPRANERDAAGGPPGGPPEGHCLQIA